MYERSIQWYKFNRMLFYMYVTKLALLSLIFGYNKHEYIYVLQNKEITKF